MPKRFRFRLEPLLRLRKSLEQEAQRALAKTIEERNRTEEVLKNLQLAFETALKSRRSEPGAPIDIAAWKSLERFLVRLERQIRESAEKLMEADKRVLEARQKLAKAHRDHLTLLRLKERRKDEYDLEMLHQEISTLDEVAVLRYRFKTSPTQSE